MEECIHSDKKISLLNIGMGMETCNCELSFFFIWLKINSEQMQSIWSLYSSSYRGVFDLNCVLTFARVNYERQRHNKQVPTRDRSVFPRGHSNPLLCTIDEHCTNWATKVTQLRGVQIFNTEAKRAQDLVQATSGKALWGMNHISSEPQALCSRLPEQCLVVMNLNSSKPQVLCSCHPL